MADDEELLDEKQAIERLNKALVNQYRSALQYSIAAASLLGIEAQAVGEKLTEFGDEELADARLLIEKISPSAVSRRPRSPARVPTRGAGDALDWLIRCEEEGVEALQAAIEPTGREGRSEALEHMLEHLIMRKQRQIDFMQRATG